MEDEPTIEQAVAIIAESYMNMAEYAADIAYSRRTLYVAYLSEGFTPEESLELCRSL